MARICGVKVKQRMGLCTLIDVLPVHNAISSYNLQGSVTVEYVISLPRNEGKHDTQAIRIEG
jgi:hypothetical protein